MDEIDPTISRPRVPRSGPTCPPSPAIAWHAMHCFATKISRPRRGRLEVHALGRRAFVAGLQVCEQIAHLAAGEIWPWHAARAHDLGHLRTVIPHDLRHRDRGEQPAILIEAWARFSPIAAGRAVALDARLGLEHLLAARRVARLAEFGEVVAIRGHERDDVRHLVAREHGRLNLEVVHLLAHDRRVVPERARHIQHGPGEVDAPEIRADAGLAAAQGVALHALFLREETRADGGVVGEFDLQTDERRLRGANRHGRQEYRQREHKNQGSSHHPSVGTSGRRTSACGTGAIAAAASSSNSQMEITGNNFVKLI